MGARGELACTATPLLNANQHTTCMQCLRAHGAGLRWGGVVFAAHSIDHPPDR